jgi:hypothetical protein
MRFERFLWAFPAVYALHIIEEYGAGFPAWMTLHMHADMTNGVFLLNNALFMAILLTTSAWASASRSRLSAFVFLGERQSLLEFHLPSRHHAARRQLLARPGDGIAALLPRLDLGRRAGRPPGTAERGRRPGRLRDRRGRDDFRHLGRLLAFPLPLATTSSGLTRSLFVLRVARP